MDKPLIDWFTIIAQIINFLILIYLLKRFLYGPILRAMKERENKIASRLEEAGKSQEDAAKELRTYQDKVEKWEAERESHLKKLKEEIERQRKDLLRKTREEVDLERIRWLESFQEEKEEVHRDFHRQLSTGVLEIARRTLADMADAELEVQAIRVFLRHLKELPEEQRQKLNQSLQQSPDSLVVESAFDIPDPFKKSMTRTLHELLHFQGKIKYSQNPKFLCGIGMSTGDFKLTWETNHYLDGLKEELTSAIARRNPGILNSNETMEQPVSI